MVFLISRRGPGRGVALPGCEWFPIPSSFHRIRTKSFRRRETQSDLLFSGAPPLPSPLLHSKWRRGSGGRRDSCRPNIRERQRASDSLAPQRSAGRGPGAPLLFHPLGAETAQRAVVYHDWRDPISEWGFKSAATGSARSPAQPPPPRSESACGGVR